MIKPELNDLIPHFPANRVWRTYKGGRCLDRIAGKAEPADGQFPEDWIGSTIHAVNPDDHGPNAGISTVQLGTESMLFPDLIAKDPEYFLGEDHLKHWGKVPGVLVKLLDSSIRLHLQAHPTADFARRFMNAPSGKAEAYYVLAIREEVKDPYIYLGFQRPPARDEFRRMIEQQQIHELLACFDKIPVAPGDVIFIPGGRPHAIGEGVFMVEILEPSDLAVRFEFERDGMVIPESARFMNRGLEFCLDIFDMSPLSADEARRQFMPSPQVSKKWGSVAIRETLIDKNLTPCFRVERTRINGTFERTPEEFFFAIVTCGELQIQTGRETRNFRQFEKFMIPAGLGDHVWSAKNAEVLECYPPENASAG
jgi:mannose-6-phosphate isomerase